MSYQVSKRVRSGNVKRGDCSACTPQGVRKQQRATVIAGKVTDAVLESIKNNTGNVKMAGVRQVVSRTVARRSGMVDV